MNKSSLYYFFLELKIKNVQVIYDVKKFGEFIK